MSKKIYISDIDSPLGYHLLQNFRDDHLDLHRSTLIVGTAKKGQHLNGVYQTIVFSKQPQLACRAAMDCDVIVLNLREPTHEAETIIKFLENVHDSLTKSIRIVGVSTVMTWAGLKAYQTEKDGGDRQKLIANILDQSCWKEIEYKDDQFSRRVSNNYFIKHYELQNMLLKLNKFKNIKASILCTGIIYGKENSEIQNDILKSLQGQEMTVMGNGKNKLPMVHIDTLIEALTILLDNKTSSPYSIILDAQLYSQIEIKQFINHVTANNTLIKKKQPTFLTKDECLFTFNQTLLPSTIFSSCINKSNFQSYSRNKLFADFCQYNVYSPLQAIAFIQNFQQNTLKQMTELINPKITIITQQEIEKINQQIVNKLTPPQTEIPKRQNKTASKPSSSQHQRQVGKNYYKQVLQTLLQHRKYNKYLIICKNAMKQYITDAYYFGELIEIKETKDQESDKDNFIIFKSKEFRQLFDLQQPQQIINKVEDMVDSLKKTQKNIYIPEKDGKKDQKLLALNQYLFDNVLGAVSQAKFNMKLSKKPQNLKNLICELKQIWQRSNYKSCLEPENKIPTK